MTTPDSALPTPVDWRNLIQTGRDLLNPQQLGRLPTDEHVRRAVSNIYYALFHALSESNATAFIGSPSIIRNDDKRGRCQKMVPSDNDNGWTFGAWFHGLRIMAKGKAALILAIGAVFMVPIALALSERAIEDGFRSELGQSCTGQIATGVSVQVGFGSGQRF